MSQLQLRDLDGLKLSTASINLLCAPPGPAQPSLATGATRPRVRWVCGLVDPDKIAAVAASAEKHIKGFPFVRHRADACL